MKKRWICALLAAVMLLGMIPMTAMAGSLTTSKSGVNLIKQLEGFQKYPVQDYSQYSVGYGSSCQKNDYPNGITEAEAETLLRASLKTLEEKLNSFAVKNGLSFTQNQFDALISFTYNVGVGWMSDTEGMFRAAVINRSTGNDFLFAITRWSSAGSVVQKGLVERRLAEANLYLNGIYSDGYPANYAYVLYEANLPDAVNSIRVQAYDSSVGAAIRSEPTRNGYTFLGWYTEAQGGKAVTALNASTAEMTLYAHWQKGTGEVDANGDVVGVAANYVMYAAPDGSAVVYRQPTTSSEKLRTLEANAEITVVAEHMDINGHMWGQLADGGWVTRGQANTEIQPTDVLEEPLTVTVTSNSINVRFGPGTSYAKIGQVFRGQELTIVGTSKGGQYLWGKYAGGWVCLDYTDYDAALADRNSGGDGVIGIGTVVKTSKVTVRSGPGTAYEKVGSLAKGDTVEILGQRETKGKIWYKIATGWVCSDYMTMTPVADVKDPETTEPVPTEPTPTEPDAPKDEGVIGIGTVVKTGKVNVRSGPGTGYQKVGSLAKGDTVEILGQQVTRGKIWYETAVGWVCSDYMTVTPVVDVKDPEPTEPAPTEPVPTEPAPTEPAPTEPAPTEPAPTEPAPTEPAPTEPAPTEPDDSGDDGVIDTGTVINCDTLRIRAGAGTKYECIGKLACGAEVEIYDYTVVKGTVWGRIDLGWISMDYIRIHTSENADDVLMATVTNCKNVNVRSGAGTGYAKVGSIPYGTRVQVLQLMAVSGGAVWARLSEGWVHTDYLKLDEVADAPDVPEAPVEPEPPVLPEEPSGEEKPEAGETSELIIYGSVYKCDSLRIRSGPGSGYRHIGDLACGAKVEILELRQNGVTTWGKTKLGWISLFYVNVQKETSVPGVVTGTVCASNLAVRTGAGVEFEKIEDYRRGNKIVILEQTTVDGELWGRTDLGWISMEYIQ